MAQVHTAEQEHSDESDDELEGTAYDKLIEDLYMTVPEDEPNEA